MDPNQDQPLGMPPPPDNNTPPPTPPAQPPVDPNAPPPPVDPNAQPPQPPAQPETPAYLQGAEAPPGPGQAMHPPGGYQPQPGESVQTSVAGGAVVQNQAGDTVSNTQTPVFTPPTVPQPGPPPTAAPQVPQPVQPQPTTYQAPRSSGMTAERFKKLGIIGLLMVIIGVVLLIALGGGGSEANTEVDTELENDLTILFIGAENYSLQFGEYPSLEPEKFQQFRDTSLPSNFLSPVTGDAYVLTTEEPGKGEVQYILGGQCGADGKITQSGSEEVYAMKIVLTDNTSVCKDKTL